MTGLFNVFATFDVSQWATLRWRAEQIQKQISIVAVLLRRHVDGLTTEVIKRNLAESFVTGIVDMRS